MYLLEPISVAFGDGDFGSVGWHAGSLARHLKSPEIRIVEGLVYREWHSPAGVTEFRIFSLSGRKLGITALNINAGGRAKQK